MLLTEIATLERLLQDHAEEIGHDLPGYRNHAYRVANLCVALCSPNEEQLEKIAIAAAFHDVGIWTDRTFDYLDPSVRLASAHLLRRGSSEWTSDISAMILEHHGISPRRRDRHSLIESFRRADWVDVSRGLITFGLERRVLREIFSEWPNAGFHQRLVQLSLQRWRSHPFSPLPMMRL